ncbi:hypothetical protein F0562_031959 [Nyssa sinensis]|uniref:Uncharacterized protein n=1 Tax=Nyssa sinensis TaxID=561372 RepID=A0A5J5AXF8_9ASTE|nr:hypothetical protein F0562_031959 [Nyssa sinensis]
MVLNTHPLTNVSFHNTLPAASFESPSSIWSSRSQDLVGFRFPLLRFPGKLDNSWKNGKRPKSFTPLVTIYVLAFYTGVIGSAVTEQLYKEKYWEDHPGEAVPIMKPKFYYSPWKILRGEVPSNHQNI